MVLPGGNNPPSGTTQSKSKPSSELDTTEKKKLRSAVERLKDKFEAELGKPQTPSSGETEQ